MMGCILLTLQNNVINLLDHQVSHKHADVVFEIFYIYLIYHDFAKIYGLAQI
jgi:hypothetical protein